MEGVMFKKVGRVEEADVSEMKSSTILGKYHAWNMESKYPIPGSMLLDDYRRRFLSMYASEEERALVDSRSERERRLEVDLVAMDRLDEHRLPNGVEILLNKLEKTVNDTKEAQAANVAMARLAPATLDDIKVFAWMDSSPPKFDLIEDYFSRGLINVSSTMDLANPLCNWDECTELARYGYKSGAKGDKATHCPRHRLPEHVDLKLKPSTRVTGLMRACKLGLLTCVRLFLKAGADASYTSETGTSCLHYAWERFMTMCKDGCKEKHVHDTAEARKLAFFTLHDIVSELLEYGANPNTCGSNGVTPLHMAAAYGHDDIVGTLLRHGADRSMVQFQGLTAEALARREKRAGAAQLLANWHHIEKAYKKEEWRTEWYHVLQDNAEISRKKIQSGNIGGGGKSSGTLFGGGQDESTKALWGDVKDPKRTAAVIDTNTLLKAHKIKEKLSEYRNSLSNLALTAAAAPAAGGGAASSGGLPHKCGDPSILALSIPTAEYDLSQDALREVNHVVDSRSAGETKRLALLEGLLEGKRADKSGGNSMPWGRRLPQALTAAQIEHEEALKEEDRAIEEAKERERAIEQAQNANSGEGEAELTLTKQNRFFGGKSLSLALTKSPTSNGLSRGSSLEVLPPGRAVNLIAQDEVGTRLSKVFGREGAGAYRTPGLEREIKMMEEAEAAASAASAARAAELEAAQAAEEARRQILLGKKSASGGHWIKNKFGKFNFVLDAPREDDSVKAARALAEDRKSLRNLYEAETKQVREKGWGDKRMTTLATAAQVKETVRKEELAMDEEDFYELEEKR